MKKFQEYIGAFWMSLVVGTLLAVYLILRRGYFDLYIANKVVGAVALILLGIVMMIGPLSRIYNLFDGLLRYRKQLGLTAFVYAAAHFIISYFLLPEKFPRSRFTLSNIPFIFGLISSILLIILFLYSFQLLIRTIERKRWWHLQNWGMRLALIAAFLHIVIMKYPGWMSWFTDGGGRELVRPYLPPASLLASIFGLFAFIVRLADSAPKAFAKLLIASCFGVILSVVVGIFILGFRQTPRALPLDWQTCIQLPASTTQESYPPTCVSVDGRRVTFPLQAPIDDPTLTNPAEGNAEYYGNSTAAACNTETDCIVTGCNSEICQGEREAVGYSICIAPGKPTPYELGYTCGCQKSRCEWLK